MRYSIPGLTAVLVITLCISLSSTNCSKKKEVITITDTVIVRVKDTTVITVHPPIDLVKDLILHYPFDNNLLDASGNNRNASPNGLVQFGTDKNNRANSAALFDGISSYITYPDTRSFSPTTVTIAMQVNYTGTDVAFLFTRQKFSDATNAIYDGLINWQASPNAQSALFLVRGESSCEVEQSIGKQDAVYTSKPVTSNEWHHLAFVFDKGVQRIYLDGILRGAATLEYKTTKECPEAALIIGAWRAPRLGLFKGKMDDFRVYNRVLTDLEIAELAKTL